MSGAASIALRGVYILKQETAPRTSGRYVRCLIWSRNQRNGEKTMRKWIAQCSFEAIVVTALAMVAAVTFGSLYGAVVHLQVVA